MHKRDIPVYYKMTSRISDLHLMATILLLWEAARVPRKISMNDLKMMNISPLTAIYWAPLPRNPAKICISTLGCIIKTVSKDLYESLNMLVVASVSGIVVFAMYWSQLLYQSSLYSVLVLALVSGSVSTVCWPLGGHLSLVTLQAALLCYNCLTSAFPS